VETEGEEKKDGEEVEEKKEPGEENKDGDEKKDEVAKDAKKDEKKPFKKPKRDPELKEEHLNRVRVILDKYKESEAFDNMVFSHEFNSQQRKQIIDLKVDGMKIEYLKLEGTGNKTVLLVRKDIKAHDLVDLLEKAGGVLPRYKLVKPAEPVDLTSDAGLILVDAKPEKKNAEKSDSKDKDAAEKEAGDGHASDHEEKDNAEEEGNDHHDDDDAHQDDEGIEGEDAELEGDVESDGEGADAEIDEAMLDTEEQ